MYVEKGFTKVPRVRIRGKELVWSYALTFVNESKYLLGDLEDSQQPNTSEHRYTELRHQITLSQDQLYYWTKHHEAIEAIEQGHEIALKQKINK